MTEFKEYSFKQSRLNRQTKLGYSLDWLKHFEHTSDFPNEMIWQIEDGLDEGINVNLYADPTKYDYMEMSNIKKALILGLDHTKLEGYSGYQGPAIIYGLTHNVDIPFKPEWSYTRLKAYVDIQMNNYNTDICFDLNKSDDEVLQYSIKAHAKCPVDMDMKQYEKELRKSIEQLVEQGPKHLRESYNVDRLYILKRWFRDVFDKLDINTVTSKQLKELTTNDI